jgi:type I restriction enzyme, S subunit
MKFDLYEPIFYEDDWDTIKLYDLADWKNGLAFRKINFSKKGKPIIKIAELKNGITNQTKFSVQEFNEEYFLEKGDMLFSWSGNPLTSIDVFWYKLSDGWLNQHIYKVKPINGLDMVFLYYLLKYLKPNFIAIAMNKQTTGLGHITLNDLKKIKVRIPKEEYQEMIAFFFSSLDDKIELNNQINRNLEELAQTIFKHWFVDFEFPDENGEPYKSSGGEMVESELGQIPKEWRVTNFNAFIDEIFNGDWGKASFHGNYKNKVFCLRGADITEICIGKNGKMPVRYIIEKNFNKKILNEGDLVIEISGGSPTQSTGRVTYINQEMLKRYNVNLICSNFCKVIKLKNINHSEYIFLFLKYLYELNIFFNFENGTTGIKNLDINNLFEKYKIVFPDEILIKKFKKIISEIFRKIQNNGNENNILSSLRDLLLPKLMSGEIRVPVENLEKDN